MLLYPFKLLLRHLTRSRTFSFINLLGLTIGLASCILISLYVYQQLSFDRFHPNHARIAFPLAGWAVSAWMQDFAYRTPIGWWLYPAGGGVVLLIALTTVAFQTLKAANANPVRSLRSE